MVDVPHDIFQQKVCNTTSPSSKKNHAIFALFFHLEITKLAFHSTPLVSMFTPGVPQVSVAVSETNWPAYRGFVRKEPHQLTKLNSVQTCFSHKLGQI